MSLVFFQGHSNKIRRTPHLYSSFVVHITFSDRGLFPRSEGYLGDVKLPFSLEVRIRAGLNDARILILSRDRCEPLYVSLIVEMICEIPNSPKHFSWALSMRRVLKRDFQTLLGDILR